MYDCGFYVLVPSSNNQDYSPIRHYSQRKGEPFLAGLSQQELVRNPPENREKSTFEELYRF